MFRQSFPTIAQPSMERIVSESRASICALCSGMTHRAGCHPASTDRRACVTSTHRAHSPPVQHSKANELGRRLMCRTRSGNSETTVQLRIQQLLTGGGRVLHLHTIHTADQLLPWKLVRICCAPNHNPPRRTARLAIFPDKVVYSCTTADAISVSFSSRATPSKASTPWSYAE